MMDRVEEQAKLITELRTGVVAGATSAKQAEQSGATTRDILRMKKELDAMKAEMAMRNMEQEADKRKRMDIDESVEEELRALMQDSAGVFTSVAEAESSLLPNMYEGESPISTERIMRTNFNGAGERSLNLDAIIAGAGGAMGGEMGGEMGGAGGRGGGRDRMGDTSVLRPQPSGGGMSMAGESLSSASKFIFPDGHSAPVGSSAPNSARGGGYRGDSSNDASYRDQRQHGGVVPSLQLDHLNQSGRQSNVDRMNVTRLYDQNNEKLMQLNQLSNNPEDMASQDQLDQLLVNFLNHKSEPNGAVAASTSRGMGPSLDGGGNRGGGDQSLRTESRYLKT